MKMNKKKSILTFSKFWFQLSGIYFAVLLGVIWFFNPNFLKITNCLVLFPLYIMFVIAAELKYKYSDDEKNTRLINTLLLTGATAILILFGMIVQYIK